MTAIELAGVTLALGSRTILVDVSLSIERGEFVGVLGPNGAGKTTLMRAILGLLRPASGTIAVLGVAAIRGNPAIGYMPQTRASQSARLTGWDFVAAAVDGHRWGLPIRGAAGRAGVDRALGLVGAIGLARRPLAELSGGERQRLLLAQALLGGPRLLLLDEPAAGMNPTETRALAALVRRIADMGTTVLLVEHDMGFVMGLADTATVLSFGRKLFHGSPQAARRDRGVIEAYLGHKLAARLA